MGAHGKARAGDRGERVGPLCVEQANTTTTGIKTRAGEQEKEVSPLHRSGPHMSRPESTDTTKQRVRSVSILRAPAP